MKKALLVFLALVFVIHGTSNLWIWVAFKIQQEYVASNLCENRFKPQTLCKGKCYLSKKLDENQKQGKDLPGIKQIDIQLIANEIGQSHLFKVPLKCNSKWTVIRDIFYEMRSLNSVFHPPQVA